VALRPDVIWTCTSEGANAAPAPTTAIPIVVAPAGERAKERLAGNFARPGGNEPGLRLNSVGLDVKCLQLLKERSSRIVPVEVLANPDNQDYGSHLQLLRPAASQLGITLNRVDARSAAELPQALTEIRASLADAIFLADAILIVDDVALAGAPEVRRQTIQWTLGQRLPLVSSGARAAPASGLVSLGTDNSALVRRAAFHVHRILGGAKPGDQPVDWPTVYNLSLNRKTAAALGRTIP
jgi:putative ABC transport system substrate-binding protein